MFENKANLNLDKVRSVLTRPTPKDKIEQRDGMGKTKLNYVPGSYVIQTVIEATENTYDFEILSSQIISAEPKAVTYYDKSINRKVAKLDKDGLPLYENQAPYVVVHARMTIPGLGSRDQYGVAELLGGTTEQAQAFKGAATDAFKKCASEFGVALDLYDNSLDVSTPNYTPNLAPKPEPKKTEFNPKDTAKLIEIKNQLGIGKNENDKLNPYAVAFFEDPNATYKTINPSNIASFNNFLETKVVQKGA